MRYRVYSLTTAQPSLLAAFNNEEHAREYAAKIAQGHGDTVPVFVVNGEIKERFQAPGPLVADSCSLSNIESLAAWVAAGELRFRTKRLS